MSHDLSEDIGEDVVSSASEAAEGPMINRTKPSRSTVVQNGNTVVLNPVHGSIQLNTTSMFNIWLQKDIANKLGFGMTSKRKYRARRQVYTGFWRFEEVSKL